MLIQILRHAMWIKLMFINVSEGPQALTGRFHLSYCTAWLLYYGYLLL